MTDWMRLDTVATDRGELVPLDQRIVELAVARQLVSPAMVAACGAQSARSDEPLRPLQLLMKQDHISASHINELLDELMGESLVCGSCSEHDEVAVDPQPEPHQQPRHLGPYELIREVARGGMGVVFEATDSELDRRVAIKVLKARSGADAVQRFEREAIVAAGLSHPNIIQIHHVAMGRGAGGPQQSYLVMDYIDGPTLAEARCQLTLERSVELLRQVAQGMGYAHREGILHRDLKPANVLISRHGDAIITDFGLARWVADPDDLTHSGVAIGTLHYMSPEQLKGERADVGPHSDVWAMGVMLYELVTGRMPFDGQSTAELMHAILTSEPRAPRQVQPSVPRELEIICLKALDRDGNRRYANGCEFADELQRWAEGEPILAHPPSLLYRIQKRLRKHPWRAAAICLLILGAAGAIAWHVGRQGDLTRLKSSAQEAHRKGHWGTAISASQQALDLDPDDAELLAIHTSSTSSEAEQQAEHARVVHYRETLKKLEPLARRIEETKPYHYIPEAHIREKLGQVYRALNELEPLTEDPRNAECEELWTILGVGWLTLGWLDLAERYLLKASELVPSDSRAHAYLGQVYLWKAIKARFSERLHDIPNLTSKTLHHLELARRSVLKRSVDAHLVETYRALASGDDQRVRTLCNEGLKRHKGRVGWEENWIALACIEKDHAKQLELLANVFTFRPHYPWLLVLRGLMRARAGNKRGEIEDDTQALAINPYSWLALYRRGNRYRDLREYDRSLADLNALIKLRPNSGLAYFARAETRYEMGDKRGAHEDLAYVKDRRLITGWQLKALVGDFYMRTGAYHRSLSAYADSLRLNPLDERVLYGKANLHWKLREYKTAIMLLSFAISKAPYIRARHYYLRARIHAVMGNHARAIADFTSALERGWSRKRCLSQRAALHLQIGDVQRCIRDCDGAIELGPSLNLYVIKARALESGGYLRKSLECLSEAVDVSINAHEKARAYVFLGRSYEKLSRTEDALGAYKAAANLDPTLVTAYVNLGLLEKKLGNLTRAERDLTQAISLNPKEAYKYLLVRARVYMAQGLLNKSRADLRRCLACTPSTRDGLLARARAFQELDSHTKAVGVLTELLQRDSLCARALYRRSRSLEKLGRIESALTDIMKAARLEPCTLHLCGAARLLSRTGRSAESLRCLDKALKISPGAAMVYRMRAKVLASLGRVPDAISDLGQVLRRLPNDSSTLIDRGLLLLKKRRYRAAVSDFSNAILIAPRSVTAYLERAQAYSRLREFRSAVRDYLLAIQLRPKRASTYVNLGIVYCLMKREDLAIVQFDQAIRLAPQDPLGHYNRGCGNASLGRFRESISDFSNAIERDPNYARAWSQRGRVQVQLGQPKRAAADLERAVTLNPASWRSRRDLAVAYTMIGAKVRARQSLREAIRLAPKEKVPQLKADLDKLVE